MKKKSNLPFFPLKLKSSPLHIFLLGAVAGFVAASIAGNEKRLSSLLQSKASKQASVEKTHPSLFSAPVHAALIERLGYTLSYDGKNRIPRWVYERLTDEGLKGGAESHRYRFLEDEAIPKHLRSTQDDYVGSEYRKAQLCPPHDQRASSRAMYDTFYLSNAVPEVAKSTMERLERQSRLWTKRFKDLHVISGPLFLPREGDDGNRYVSYRVIGPNDVAVPTHFFKVLLGEKSSGEVEMLAFLIPNEEVDPEVSLDNYLVSVEKVESLSGLEFFKDLKVSEQTKAKVATSLW